eukprot:m.109299 g.109299  ORF g.109299 m.109299 type:complete len:323 (+) comp9295_c1_seq5:144-1112(+)
MARWLRPHLVHLGTAAFALFVIYSLATLCALSFDSRLGLDDGLDDFEIPGAAIMPHWEAFPGMCTPQNEYVLAQVQTELLCKQLCLRIETCEAFSLENGDRCMITSNCDQREPDPQSAWETFIKPPRLVFRRSESDPSPKGLAHIPSLPPLSNAGAKDRHDSCSYCPPQNQCEQPRLCRAGRCFHGLPLPDGTPCDDGDQDTFGDHCIKGQCRPSGRLAVRQSLSGNPDAHKIRIGDRTFNNIYSVFSINNDIQCNDEFTVAMLDATVDLCARECLSDIHRGRCKAFSVEPSGLQKCLLFESSSNCKSAKGWVSGTIRNTSP